MRTAHRPYNKNSVSSQVVSTALSLSIRPLAALAVRHPASFFVVRKLFRGLGVVLERVPRQVRILPIHQAHVRGEWVISPRAQQSQKAVLYLHGGGYFFGAGSLHRQLTWRLSQALARPVLAIDYRLAPRHSFEDWRDDALQAYQHLLAQGYRGEDLLVAGDSAGGHLTLVLLQTLRDRGLPLPVGAIAISPWTDMSMEAKANSANARRDPMLPVQAIDYLSRFLVAHRSPYDALVSPLHGSFQGLPPLYVMVGSTEILREDARGVVEKARADGVAVTYEEWHRMPHVFPILASVLPEGRRAFGHMRRFVQGTELARTEARESA